MSQRVHFVTLGVADLAEARRFYVEGLGWEPTLEVAGEVIFIQVAHGVLLSLWNAAEMAAVVGEPVAGPGAVALAHNVERPEQVAEFLARAEAAGATIIVPARRATWGGVQGWFADPAGFRWEVAHNPALTVDAAGTVSFRGP
jgi:catechol 2,3-dioxygenase-like lactoylglutathione lyase family enzyme